MSVQVRFLTTNVIQVFWVLELCEHQDCRSGTVDLQRQREQTWKIISQALSNGFLGGEMGWSYRDFHFLNNIFFSSKHI